MPLTGKQKDHHEKEFAFVQKMVDGVDDGLKKAGFDSKDGPAQESLRKVVASAVLAQAAAVMLLTRIAKEYATAKEKGTPDHWLVDVGSPDWRNPFAFITLTQEILGENLEACGVKIAMAMQGLKDMEPDLGASDVAGHA